MAENLDLKKIIVKTLDNNKALDIISIDLKDKSSIEDLRKEIIKYLDINFKGNENFIKVVKSSAFCSERDWICLEEVPLATIMKSAIDDLSLRSIDTMSKALLLSSVLMIIFFKFKFSAINYLPYQIFLI